jgi:hypothetical protein
LLTVLPNQIRYFSTEHIMPLTERFVCVMPPWQKQSSILTISNCPITFGRSCNYRPRYDTNAAGSTISKRVTGTTPCAAPGSTIPRSHPHQNGWMRGSIACDREKAVIKEGLDAPLASHACCRVFELKSY